MNAIENTSTMESHHCHTPTSSRAAKIRSFIWHLFQMVVAMQLGMMLYMFFLNRLAPASYRAARAAYPLFDFWMMMIAMTVPMIVPMRYHRHSLRYCIGMTIAMLAPVGLLTVLTQFDLISIGTLHVSSETAMVLGMAIYMLFRRH